MKTTSSILLSAMTTVAIGLLFAQQVTAQTLAQTSSLSDLVAPTPKNALASRARLALVPGSDGKVYEFRTNQVGQLITTKRVGGLEVQYRYKGADAKQPSAVKIGSRRWIEVTPDMLCAPSKSAALLDDGRELVSDSTARDDGSATNPPEQISSIGMTRKWVPGEEEITQQEVDEMQQMINLQYSFALDYYQFGPREDCIAGCDIAYDISQVLCAGMSVLNPLAGFVCISIATAGKYACKAACRIYP